MYTQGAAPYGSVSNLAKASSIKGIKGETVFTFKGLLYKIYFGRKIPKYNGEEINVF